MSFIDELKRRNVVRVGVAYVLMGWLVLQAADFALDLIDAPNWVIQTFFIAVIIGLPVALFFAWAFELTPEGIKREAEVERDVSITPQTGRKLDRAIMVFLVLAVGVLLVDRFRSGVEDAPAEAGAPSVAEAGARQEALQREADAPGAPATDDKSIAVLPLANRSASAEDAYFAEGLHDEILTQLSRIASLRVISRTSVMGYAGTTKRMPEIGAELGVATLLEGGVQRAGDRVRINVQLIDAATDEHLWAEVYDRELTADNLFDIQSDITRAIASALRAVLTGEEERSLERKPTENVEAYAWFLRGRAASKSYGREGVEIGDSIESFEQAIALDPTFASAHAYLAVDYLERYWINSRVDESTRVLDLRAAEASLERARELAPDAAETLSAEGYYHYWGHLDYDRAIAAFDRALAREPGNTHAMRGKAYAQRRQGDLSGSLASFERILALDPLDLQISADAAYVLMHLGRLREADDMVDRAMKLSPDNNFTRMVASLVAFTGDDLPTAKGLIGSMGDEVLSYLVPIYVNFALAEGDFEQARSAISRADSSMGTTALEQARVLWYEGDHAALAAFLADQSAEIIERVEAQPDNESAHFDHVLLRGLQGNRSGLEEAIQAYEVVLRPDAMRVVENSPLFEAYLFSGQHERAIDQMQRMVDAFGPWELAFMHQAPLPESLRSRPRFQALMNQYRDWLRTARPDRI